MCDGLIFLIYFWIIYLSFKITGFVLCVWVKNKLLEYRQVSPDYLLSETWNKKTAFIPFIYQCYYLLFCHYYCINYYSSVFQKKTFKSIHSVGNCGCDGLLTLLLHIKLIPIMPFAFRSCKCCTYL